MILSSMVNTGTTMALTNITFDKLFTSHPNWFIGQAEGVNIALYSYHEANWTDFEGKRGQRGFDITTKVMTHSAQKMLQFI